MVEPATIAAISAGAAVVGAVEGTAQMVSGDSGVNVGRCNVHYPKEFTTEQFAHVAYQSFQQDVIKFQAFGGFWNNDLAVAATGYVSNNQDPLVGRPGSSHPDVPVNRFIVLSFDKSSNSDDMSRGLLTCNIELWGGGAADIAEGNAEDPWIALHVHGRFDPFGPGDIEYSFKLMVSSFGQIHMSDPQWTGTYVNRCTITLEGDHVRLYLN